jgi:hypothetical protein
VHDCSGKVASSEESAVAGIISNAREAQCPWRETLSPMIRRQVTIRRLTQVSFETLIG